MLTGVVLCCILSFFSYSRLCSSNASIIPWPPKVGYFTQKIDHFNYAASNVTYKMRYLFEDRWFRPNGSIFFYCGNEGPIEMFWNNSGYVFHLASTMNALVVFAEHRYYGKSLPFHKSFVQPHIQFLSVSQTLFDYAHLISGLRERFATNRTQVITFGGSYGGLLAAYMRVTFPHLVTGAIASSAPVYSVAGVGRFHEFFEAVTKDFATADQKCAARIRDAYALLDQLVRSDLSNLRHLSLLLRLCKPMKTQFDYVWMLKWSRHAFVMMAMMDYPYETDFMGRLPAYPVNVSCAHALANVDLVSSLRDAVAVFYNGSQKLRCFDYKAQFTECADITGCGLGRVSLAWDFQSCTEMNLHDASNATANDMFPSLPLTRETLTEYCRSRWGVTSSFDKLALLYGPGIWKTTSNIIFSNGDLDPWTAGGVTMDQSPTVRSLLIHGGAHHLDLRTPHPKDPPSVHAVRQAEADAIKMWLKEAKSLT